MHSVNTDKVDICFCLGISKMLTPQEINWCIRDDEVFTAEKALDYSELFADVVTQNWVNICTVILINAHLVVNSINYRLAHLRPEQNKKDFWPKFLRQCPALIAFAKSAMHQYFRSQGLAVYVNFSFSLGVIDDDTGPRFLYSSRSNFQGLQSSYLIRNDATFNHFFDDILPNFCVEDYLESMLTILDIKYNGYLIPLSITFNLTRNYGIIYGLNPKKQSKNNNKTEQNNCFFDALSCLFGIRRGKIYRLKKVYNTKNRKRAKLLRCAFMRFMKRTHHDINPFHPVLGLKSDMICYVEEFLKARIFIFSLKTWNGCKVSLSAKKLVQDIRAGRKKRVKSLESERCSTSNYPSVINLISDGNHIIAPIHLDTLLKHYYCDICNYKFTQTHDLKRHKCGQKEQYNCERVFPMKSTMDSVYRDKVDPCGLAKSTGFVYVGIGREMDSIRLKIDYFEDGALSEMERENIEGKFECSFKTIWACAEFLVDSLYGKSGHLLLKRLMNNSKAITNLEKEMEKQKPCDVLYGKHCKIVEFNDLKHLKDDLMEHLTYITVYLASSGVDSILVENVNDAILKVLLSKYGKEKVEIFFNKGKLCQTRCLNGRLNFIVLNLFSMSLISENVMENGFKTMKSVVKSFLSQFGLDITSFRSATTVGTRILSQSLKFSEKLTLISPSKFLYEALSNTVRYGILGAERIVFGKGLPYKTAVLMDLERFYLSILSNLKMWTGIGILYKKDEDSIFRCQPTRKRHCYANIFFNFLAQILPDESKLLFAGEAGYELRSGVRSLCVDGVLYEAGERRYLAFDGCFYHPHFVSSTDQDFENNECHFYYENQSKDHSSTCEVCKNAQNIKNNCVKPSLFRLSKGESFDSKHKLRKGKSYKEIYEDEKKLEKENFGDEIVKLIKIRECTVLRFFQRPISEFCAKLNIKFRPEFGNLLLGPSLLNSAKLSYPLMRFNGKIKESALIDMIRLGKVFGFINCSVKMSHVGQKLLHPLKPFSFKKNDKVENVYEFQDECVASNLLHKLLGYKELGISVTHVNWFYEFKEPKERIFGGLKEDIMKCITDEKNDYFARFLKLSLNSAVGWLAIKFNRYGKSVLMENDDLPKINQMRGLVCTAPLSQTHSIMHFNDNTQKTFNLAHIHCQVISEGRATLLSIILDMKCFLDVDCLMANCDSLTIFYKNAIDLNIFNDAKTCLFLDMFLKNDLSYNTIVDYVKWKVRLFKQPFVCSSHTVDYIDSLYKKIIFVPKECCKMSAGEPYPFKLKVEIVADHGLMRTATHLTFFNTKSNDLVQKCSGRFDPVFDKVPYVDSLSLNTLL